MQVYRKTCKNTAWMNTLWKYTFCENTLWEIHFGRIHFRKSHFQTTVAQKCSAAMETRKYDQLTYRRTDRLTWVGAGDTCVSKNLGEKYKKFREKFKK